jgi:CxxC motif-containing protein (DUF1111 family)
MRKTVLPLILISVFICGNGAFAQNANPPRGNGGNRGANPLVLPGVSDPGVRQGTSGAGGPLDNLDVREADFFDAARLIFAEVTSVVGSIPGEAGQGLGPRFNATSCAECHSFPALGGSSPARNPQIDVATRHGAQNIIPSFIAADGPAKVARFVLDAAGQRDGGVHALFVITGRTDAPHCDISQPNFAAETAANNVVFRIPTPLYGLGLVENTPDANLLAAFASNAAAKSALGVTGRFNVSDNDGSILRFGWKSQNKSIGLFTGEAFNVEQGVTNEIFPNEREDSANCQFTALPEDHTRFETTPNTISTASTAASRTSNAATFIRLLAAPTPVATAGSQRGAQVFTNIGCHTCHVVTQTTGRSEIPSLDRVSYHPYSDFALHNMGQRLNDGVAQGVAGGPDWRTAPLWGLGQRLFFLHDGRTSDLVNAIASHASPGSEANAVIDNFNNLPRSDIEDLLTFLRSL